jgi:hypothetical protein
MKYIFCPLLLLSLFATPVFSRAKYQGSCPKVEQSPTSVTGRSTPVEQTRVTCTVTVYLAGTKTPADLYEAGGRALPNPFSNQNTTTGQFLFHVDNGHYDVKIAAGQTVFSLDGISIAESAAGCFDYARPSAGDKLAACLSEIPPTGGTADARGIAGNQLWQRCPFEGVIKPVHLLLGAGTTTIETSCNIPSNITLEFAQGSILSIAGGATLTIAGSVQAPLAQIFSGAGAVTFNSTPYGGPESVGVVFPQWWGAKGDGQYGVNCLVKRGSTALMTSNGRFRLDDIGKTIIVYGAGPSSANLTTTISSVTSPNSVVLAESADTETGAGSNCVWATDDTAALQAALAAFSSVQLPAGNYGFTTLRLKQGQNVIGAGMENTKLLRLAAHTLDRTSSAVAMRSGETAEFLNLQNFAVWCNNLGSNANCLELGTEAPGMTDFASGSLIQNLKITGATGTGVKLRTNAPGGIRNLWIMNFSHFGTAPAAVAPTSRALEVEGNTLNIDGLHVEGYYANGDVVFGAAMGIANNVDMELFGDYRNRDAIVVAAPTHLSNVFIYGPGAARRDVIRITAEYTSVKSVFINQAGGAIKAVNGINDMLQSVSIPATEFYVPHYDSLDVANSFGQRVHGKVNFYRELFMQGAIPTITFNSSTGKRAFSIRNENNQLVIRDVVNAADVFTIQPDQAAIALPGGIQIVSRAGVPTGGCTKGSLWLRTDGGPGATLYVCESGVGWMAK